MIRSTILRVPAGDSLEAAARRAAAEILGVADPAAHPDYEEYRPDGNVFRVPLVEQLVFRSVLAPAAGERRVFAVLEPERMSDEAANLLLKTLEEPPPSLHLFFVTSRPFDLPATVRSRCRLVSVPRADREVTLQAAGFDHGEARRLAFLAGSAEGVRRVADDPHERELLEAWAALPGQLGALPASCLDIPPAVERVVSFTPSGDEEARRRQRRQRTDEPLAGLSVLAYAYREVLARSLGAPLDGVPPVEAAPSAPVTSRLADEIGADGALAALGHIAAARDAILANGTARLALEALFVRLGALAQGETGPGDGVAPGYHDLRRRSSSVGRAPAS